MSDDDRLLEHLRTVADQAPPVPLDSSRVLALGRRRRAARSAGIGLATIAAVASVYSGVSALPGPNEGMPGPAAPSESQSPSPSTEHDAMSSPPTAVVDEQAGTISLPLDEWTWSAGDLATVETAEDLYVSRCMADAGLGEEYVFRGPAPVQPERVQYGVWRHEVVLETGYGSLSVIDRDGAGLRGDHPDIRIQVECYARALEEGLTYDPGQFEEAAPRGWESGPYLPEGQLVMEEWRQCLADNDVVPPGEDAGIPPAALGAPLDEQIRIGLIDVDCKEEVDFVQRMADIEAREQAAYIERGRDYLEARRQVEQSALAKAREYLADAGVPIPGE